MNQGLSMRSLLFAAVAVISITVSYNPDPAAAQDVAAGEKSFRKCAPCHAIGPGAQNKVGPEQNGLDGRKAGTAFPASRTRRKPRICGPISSSSTLTEISRNRSGIALKLETKLDFGLVAAEVREIECAWT
jgi:hypothetical protein